MVRIPVHCMRFNTVREAGFRSRGCQPLVVGNQLPVIRTDRPLKNSIRPENPDPEGGGGLNPRKKPTEAAWL
jgi:hypothetical protein